MQDHPNPGAPPSVPPRDSADHEAQRWVLLELVTDPPAGGDDINRLADVLRERPDRIAAAVDALVAVGLATRDGHSVRATAAALRFDALWPAGG
jgi:hypothetical protein